MTSHPNRLPQPQSEPRVEPLPQTAQLPRRLPSWRLWLPLLFQTGLILAVPAQDAYTYATGRQITLQTALVDPYDLLRGHYQTLSYTISQADQLKKLPGGEWFNQARSSSEPFYLVLEAPANQNSRQPWKPIRVSSTHPTDLADNQVAIQGKASPSEQITYGIETYYMPEAQRTQLNQDISQQAQSAYVADVKVDSTGNAVPVSLWVGDRKYRF